MEGKFVNYEGGRIYYTDRGDGNVIILVHGYLETSEVWGSFAELLSGRNRVICVDLPGNGKSSLFQQPHTMCFHAAAIVRIMDTEGIETAIVAGHSLGGYVTLSMVEHYASRLKGYILFHSHPFPDSDEAVQNRRREIKVVRSGKKDLIYPVNIPRMFADMNLEKFADDVERLKNIASGHRGEGIIAILEGMINRKSREKIMSECNLPLLYFLGRHDNYIPLEITGRLNLPDRAKLVILNESGHMGFLEETEKSLGEVEDFISSVI